MSSKLTKTNRSLRALFILAGFLVVFWIGAGSFLLISAYPHPEITEPIWKSGQYMLFVGFINLMLYGAIYWQVRKLLRGSK